MISAQIGVYDKNIEQKVRNLFGEANLRDLEKNEYFTFVLTIKNDTPSPLQVRQLYATIDDSEPMAWCAGTIAPGEQANYHIYHVHMGKRQKEGTYRVKYYLNGKVIHQSCFTFRDSPRQHSTARQLPFCMPTAEQIARFPNPENLRSQYISGVLYVEPDIRYTEYAVDFKADHLPNGTYCCPCTFHLAAEELGRTYGKPESNQGITGYAGLQSDCTGKRVGIMSIWDAFFTDPRGKRYRCRPTLAHPQGVSAREFGGEGTGAQYIAPHFWEASHWYRLILRCGRDRATGNVIVAMYLQDLQTMQYLKFCAYDTLMKDTCFIGSPVVFLENFDPRTAGQVRSMEIRNARIKPRGSDTWLPLKQMFIAPNSSAFIDRYIGSYAYGIRNDRFWMITSGVGGDWYRNGKGQQGEWFTLPG